VTFGKALTRKQREAKLKRKREEKNQKARKTSDEQEAS